MIYDSSSPARESVTAIGRIKGQTRPPKIYEKRGPLPASRRVTRAVPVLTGLILLVAGLFVVSMESVSDKAKSLAAVPAAALIAPGCGIFGFPLSRRMRIVGCAP